MSVYKNDKPKDFLEAIDSIYYNQTIKPNDIVLVVDGPIDNELKSSIDKVKNDIKEINVIWLENNCGHAIARQTAIEHSKYDIIALMDSDDISVNNRFESQLKIFEKKPEISIVGGLIYEFVNDVSNIVSKRIVPQHDNDIKKYMQIRCPLNFVTCMMRKADIMNVGGIQDWYCEEDYYLWIRLSLSNYKFHNIQENLVFVRVGKEMYNRRGGWKYFKSEASIQKYMYNNNIIGIGQLTINLIKRAIVQILLPNSIRGWVYRNYARN